MKKCISFALILALLVSMLTGITAGAVEEITEKKNSAITEQDKAAYAELVKNKTPDNETIDPEFTLIDENDNLALYAITDKTSKRIGEILIKDKTSGYVWRSNPEDADEDIIAKSSGDAYNKSKSQIVFEYSKGFNANQYKNSYADSAEKGLVECEIEDDGVKFIYKFAFKETINPIQINQFKDELRKTGKNKHNINVDDFGKTHYFVIPVKYSITGDAFNAEILVNDEDAVFKFTKPGNASTGSYTGILIRNFDYHILKIELLPAFGATSYNESGYMFIPDGSGAIVNMNNGRKNIPQQPYSAPVYGSYKERDKGIRINEDYNKFYYASDRYMLPVFGTVRDDGHALMGIVKDNAAISYVNVIVSGYESSYNKVYPSFLNKIVQDVAKVTSNQPVDQTLRDASKNYSVSYYCLNGDDANYVGMAKRYRKYLVDEKGMEKSDDYREGALVLDMYAGVEKKTSIMGIPWNKFEVMTTYKDLIRIADEMTESGIDNLVFKYNDWIKMNDRKKIQVKPNFEGAIGGKKGYKDAYNYLSSKNISLYMNVDFINFSDAGNGYNIHADSVKYTNQAPAYQTSGFSAHINMGRRWCLLKAPLVKEAAMSFAEKCAENEIHAVSIENMGSILYADGANKDANSRGDSANIFSGILSDYKAKGINIITSEPGEYALIDTDVVMELPSKETYVELANEAVPFYQIAIRGLKTYVLEPVNMSSRPDDVILNALESGACLSYSLVAGDTTGLKETYLKYLYSSNYSQWKDEMVEDYKGYADIMKMVEGQDIVNHEKIKKDVYATTYANGVKVYVNYSTSEQSVDGSGIVIPGKGYTYERGAM